MKINLDLFGDHPFPSSTLVTYKDREWDSDCYRIKKTFTGKRIKDISTKVLIESYPAVDMCPITTTMSDEAFVFFLPALMQASIDGQEDINGLLPENRLAELGDVLTLCLRRMAQEGDKNHRFKMLNKMYSHEQKREIARFLVVMRDYDPNNPWPSAVDALRIYWGQFL